RPTQRASRRPAAEPSYRDLPARPAMRLTYRTLSVLSVIAERPGLSNREISDLVGITDQGQICKLLSRLAKFELIENTGDGQPLGAANAWQLLARGSELLQAVGHRPADEPRSREVLTDAARGTPRSAARSPTGSRR
ncbi:MAG TPA: hypothetical protein VN804_01995, partial [Solirubrobacteraceae bacterium]|nr:hypothetical protein [Solirubrobacteraceae bacterium]